MLKSWAWCVVLWVVVLGANGPRAERRSDAIAIKDADGTVSCVIARIDPSSVVPDFPDTDLLLVSVREPVPPPPNLLAVLDPSVGDFAQLPIHVFLIPATSDATARLRVIEPLFMEQTLGPVELDGASLPDRYLTAKYPRALLVSGIDVVGQRTAKTLTGQAVVAETRCRIRDQASAWR